MGFARNSPIVAGTVLIRSSIQSANYVAGVSGWSINQDGSYELGAGGTIRGDLLITGTNGNYIQGTTSAGQATFRFRPQDLTGVPAADIGPGVVYTASVDIPPTNQYMQMNVYAPHIVGDAFPRLTMSSRDTLSGDPMQVILGDSSVAGNCDLQLNGAITVPGISTFNGLVNMVRAGTQAALRVRQAADTQQRLEVDTAGVLRFGSGAAVVDTNLFRSAADVLRTDDSLEVGTTLRVVSTGGNPSIGRATLVAGTVTVNNTKVTAASNIIPICQVSAGTPGFLRISARVVGTSFTILSSNAADTSTVSWWIVEPV